MTSGGYFFGFLGGQIIEGKEGLGKEGLDKRFSEFDIIKPRLDTNA